ncbi:MAG: helix-turn-helix domain-containing protein, partial [Alphaproteobacteria bacterium]
AHAILLLDDGMSAPDVARVMYVDDDTVYQWHRRWGEGGAMRLSEFGWKGSSPRLSPAQQQF